jgi:hypothetical protein
MASESPTSEEIPKEAVPPTKEDDSEWVEIPANSADPDMKNIAGKHSDLRSATAAKLQVLLAKQHALIDEMRSLRIKQWHLQQQIGSVQGYTEDIEMDKFLSETIPKLENTVNGMREFEKALGEVVKEQEEVLGEGEKDKEKNGQD